MTNYPKKVQQILNEFSKKHAALKNLYGAAPFAPKIKIENQSVVITGSVLNEKQERWCLDLVAHDFSTLTIVNQLTVLDNRDTPLEYFFNNSKKIIDIFSKYLPQKTDKEKREKQRASQVLPEEIVRVVYSYRSQILLQKKDHTLGWASRKNFIPTLTQWQPPLIAEKENLYPINIDLLVQTAETFLNVPYLWGGITPAGFDCSGYVQYLFAEQGILLPKHSQDQSAYGKAVMEEALQPGDLIFLDQKKDGFHHVGIYLGNNQIIHASHRMKEVVVWEMEMVKNIYNIMVIRRITQ